MILEFFEHQKYKKHLIQFININVDKTLLQSMQNTTHYVFPFNNLPFKSYTHYKIAQKSPKSKTKIKI